MYLIWNVFKMYPHHFFSANKISHLTWMKIQLVCIFCCVPLLL